MKKLLLLISVLFSCLFVFAGSYSVKIVNAQTLTVEEPLITMSGNVVLEITTEGQIRELTAQKVVVNTQTKEITAYGSVGLTSDDLRDYTGDSLIFNWDSLDLTVFNGNSSIEKSNSEAKNIKFYIDGESVSYTGDGGPVVMDGVILSTKDEDPYWSIEADSVALLESDFVFNNAVVKLGRVPVFWIPFLYYPNTRLAINPAVGISGSKGLFLNTTYELYGKYPALWNTSNTSTAASDDSAAAFSALSLLDGTDSSSLVRRGLIYREEDTDRELSVFENRVKDSSSYFAIMADAYKNYGVVLGIDTHNLIFDSSLTLDAKAVAAYKADPIKTYYEKLRYAGDISAEYKNGNTVFSLEVPVLSDPDVKYDFYNRNTTLQLDTLLGSKATVPSYYKKGINTYTWDAGFKTSFKFLNQAFSLSNLYASRTFKWNTTKYEYEIDNSVLPELDASLSGSVFSFRKDTEKSSQASYSNDLADAFLTQYRSLAEGVPEEENIFNSYTASEPDFQTDKDSYGISLDYNAKTYLKNKKKDERSFYFKINGSVNLKADAPLDILSLTETISPTYVYTIEEERTYPEAKDLNVVSSLTLSSPAIGLKYLQSINLYRFKLSEGVETEYQMKWEKDYFNSHSIELSRDLGSYFTFTVRQQLKPLDLILTPSLKFSRGIHTINASTQLYLEDDLLFEKGKAVLEVIQKDENYDFRFTDTYDFSYEGWEGNSLVQSLSLNIFNTDLKFTQKAVLEDAFELKTLNLGLNYNKNYAKLSFKNTSFDLDELAIHLDYTLNPVYYWYNRVGFASSVAATYKKDFNNRYGSSLSFDFSLDFAVSEFAELKLKTTSTNSSFYRYYDENGNFSFKLMFDDLLRSFDFFGNGRKSTGFNLSSFSLQFVHYMHDWSLNVNATASIETKNSERYWAPEVTVFIKWNAIPELKKENTLSNNVWEY